MTNSIKGVFVFSSGNLPTVITDNKKYFHIKAEILILLHLIVVGFKTVNNL